MSTVLDLTSCIKVAFRRNGQIQNAYESLPPPPLRSFRMDDVSRVHRCDVSSEICNLQDWFHQFWIGSNIPLPACSRGPPIESCLIFASQKSRTICLFLAENNSLNVDWLRDRKPSPCRPTKAYFSIVSQNKSGRPPSGSRTESSPRPGMCSQRCGKTAYSAGGLL